MNYIIKKSKLMQEAVASDLHPEEVFRLEGYLLSLPEPERNAVAHMPLEEFMKIMEKPV